MGHCSGDVWDYTPRRIAGFLRVAQARISQEKADSLALQALAARGEPKEVKRQHKELVQRGITLTTGVRDAHLDTIRGDKAPSVIR